MNHLQKCRALGWLVLGLSGFTLAAAETTFRFEGGLLDGGVPANGTYDMTFELFDASTAGVAAGIHTNATVTVTDGAYAVELPFGSQLLDFANRWIEIAVRPAGSLADRAVLPDRSFLSAEAYASRAALADGVIAGSVGELELKNGAVNTAKLAPGAVTLDKINLAGSGEGQSIVRRGSAIGWESLSYWSLTGNGGTTPDNFLGTLDNRPLEFRVNNQVGLRLEPTAVGANIVAGAGNNVVAPGRVAGTISGGFANTVDANAATVSGGQSNTASGQASVVGGGGANTASGPRSVVAGGVGNLASELNAVVGGGNANVASGTGATVAGGSANTASAAAAVVGGGNLNVANGVFGGVAAGQGNAVTNDFGFVGGGGLNTAGAPYTVVSGGRSNAAVTLYGAVGGGDGNTAIGGYSTVGGGRFNTASGVDSAVPGGRENVAAGFAAAVLGGAQNQASGDYATAAGGVNNRAGGFASFAAGIGALADHAGAFVWSDNVGGEFASTADNQFLIRATGGVGIGIDQPQAALDVNGSIRAAGFQMPVGAANGRVLTADADGVATWQPVAVRYQASGSQPNMVGGANNVISNSAAGATISGGYLNRTGHEYATIGGGRDNRAYGPQATVGGGRNNRAESQAATISGGQQNLANNFGATVAGGQQNSATGYLSVVSGGLGNEVRGQFATISGGIGNLAAGERAVVGGGNNNRGDGDYSVASGGDRNWATGLSSAIGGGADNVASEEGATVGGGYYNTAAGRYSAVPGGIGNFAVGESSQAAGQFALAGHDGAFVWADASTFQTFGSTGDNQFLIRAAGGVGIGVADPQFALDVDGTIRSRAGGIQFPDGTVQETAAFNGWSFADGVLSVPPAQAFGIALGDQPALRLEPTVIGANVIAGSAENLAGPGLGAVTISGGWRNTVGASGGTIGGGQGNAATGVSSTIAGGSANQTEGVRSFVGGGNENMAAGSFASVVGGQQNRVESGGGAGFLGGGTRNVVSGSGGALMGGQFNRVTGVAAVGGGGVSNTVAGAYAVVAGGQENQVEAGTAFVGGGARNRAQAISSVVAGGEDNRTTGRQSAVGGGQENHASGLFSTVPGGFRNTASGFASFAAGQGAFAGNDGAFVWADLSGTEFTSTGPNQFLIRAAGGVGIGTPTPQAALDVHGEARVSSLRIGDSATAGHVLTANHDGRAIWQPTLSEADIQTIVRAGDGAGSGLDADLLDGLDATAFAPAAHDHDGQYAPAVHNHDGVYAPAVHDHDGQYWNLGGNTGVAPGSYLGTADNQPLNLGVNGQVALRIEPTAASPNIVGGHGGNAINGGAVGAIVAGGGGEGGGNVAGADFATVSGGSGNLASGMYATVPGGRDNTAAGTHAFAAGRRAQANHNGSVVFADGQDADFNSTAANEFSARAFGGVRFVTGQVGVSPTGTRLAPGSGSWSSLSDRHAKENLQPVDAREVLARVASLPLATWNYRTQDDAIRHLGPMAQDFRAAFGLGEDDRTISSVDTDGVALAAIQGLNEKLEEKSAEVDALKQQNAELLRRLEALEQRLK